jgi:IS605 OrfB family transposase
VRSKKYGGSIAELIFFERGTAFDVPACHKEERVMSQREKADRTSVIKFEISRVLGRYARPPSDDESTGELTGELLAPFSDKGELPFIWRRRKDSDKFDKVKPTSPYVALDRVLKLAQGQLRRAGDKALIAMWLNASLPLPPLLDPDDKLSSVRAKPGNGERLHPGTVAYRTVAAVANEIPKGKEGEHVRVGSGVCAATGRKLEQLFKLHYAKNVVPRVGDRWPVSFRPTEWQLFRVGKVTSIAFNIDGTWWHVKLALPRSKHKNWHKHQRAAQVMGVLGRVLAGESSRGVKAETAPVSEKVWIPSTLALIPKHGKWQVIISYRLPLVQPLEVPNAMVIHCGLRVFGLAQDLAGLRSRGPVTWISDNGLIGRRFRFREQRRALAHSMRKWSQHGRGHKYQARMLDVDGRERAFVDDWLRRRARRLVALAKARSARIFVGTMLNARARVENSDIPENVRLATHQAPWFKFREFIAQAASKEGIPVETYIQRDHTRRCPCCGAKGPGQENAPDYGKPWAFMCRNTGCSRKDMALSLDRVVHENAFIDLHNAGRLKLPVDCNLSVEFFELAKAEELYEEIKHDRKTRADLAKMKEVLHGNAAAGKSDRATSKRPRA